MNESDDILIRPMVPDDAHSVADLHISQIREGFLSTLNPRVSVRANGALSQAVVVSGDTLPLLPEGDVLRSRHGLCRESRPGRRVVQQGQEIAAYCHRHLRLARITTEQLNQDLCRAIAELSNRIGQPIAFFRDERRHLGIGES